MRHPLRAVVLGLALAGAVGPAAAQVEYQIKGGLSVGDVTNADDIIPGVDNGARTGFGVGVGAAWRGGGVVGFAVEALFAQRGVTGAGSDITAERKLDYIDLPALLRLSAPSSGGTTLYLFAGPQLSLELRCRTGEADCLGETSTTDFAAVGGAGVRLKGKPGLLLEARYIHGFTDLDLSSATATSSYKTRAFMVMAGVAY